MCVDSLACESLKEGESDCFIFDRAVRQSCVMSPCLNNEFMNAVMKEVKMQNGRVGVGRDWRLSGILYADNFVSFGKQEKDLKVTNDGFLRSVRKETSKSMQTKSIWVCGVRGRRGIDM